MHFVVQVWRSGQTSIAYFADLMSFFDFFPRANSHPVHVGIQGFVSVAMTDFDTVAIAGMPSCFYHDTVAGCLNSGTDTCREVETGVEFYERTVEGKIKRPDIIREQLDGDLIPKLGRMRIAEVKPMDIDGMIRAILERGSPVMANRVLATTKAVFSYAIRRI